MNISIDKCIEKRDLIQKIKAVENNMGKKERISKNVESLKSIPSHEHIKKERGEEKQNDIDSNNDNNNNKQNKRHKAAILYDTILYDTRESKQQTIKRVDVWIHRWSYRRSFRQLLNSILGYKSSDKLYINRGKCGDENYSLMIKLYKKAIMLIHPDKHVNSCFEIRYKAGEMFKILNKSKQKYEKRNNLC